VADLAGYNRSTDPSQVPVNTASTKLPERIAPGRSTGVAVMGSEVPAPEYAPGYETGPTGVKGDVE